MLKLKYYEEIDENIWQDIYRDDFLELLVTPRFSKIKEISNKFGIKTSLVKVKLYRLRKKLREEFI